MNKKKSTNCLFLQKKSVVFLPDAPNFRKLLQNVYGIRPFHKKNPRIQLGLTVDFPTTLYHFLFNASPNFLLAFVTLISTLT